MQSNARTVLVTGGAGFIGSNFIRHILRTYPDVHIINYDLLTYAGNVGNNKDVALSPRYDFVRGDITNAANLREVCRKWPISLIVNFAAETHVDRSIQDSSPFVRTNVLGTQCLLECAREFKIARYVQISTDEVYGSLGLEGRFSETTPLNPTNPYAATKAAADLLALSYWKTFGVPVVITRCSNNYGPHQFPEKFVPLMITNALEGKSIPVYGDGLNRREWIYVEDHSRGVWLALNKGKPGEVYNIGGGHEVTNIDLARLVLRLMGKSESLLEFVEDRPAHDRRYAIDCSRIESEWNWSANTDFSQGITETIEWYRNHMDWVANIKDQSYLSYYDQMYTHRVRRMGQLG
jgi:dTDP-glucose 4,6-dehydratase